MNIREEIRAWLDSCYSDRPDNGYWMIFEYHLDQLEQLFQKEVVAELEKYREVAKRSTSLGDYYLDTRINQYKGGSK